VRCCPYGSPIEGGRSQRTKKLVISGSYQNNQNGALNYQLTDVERGGKGDCAGVNSESVDVCQGGYTVLCKCHQSYTVVSLP
jgi:hypothetical protein